MKWTIETCEWQPSDGIRHYGKAIVFLSQDRPFSKGDIVGDLVWRREHQPALSPNDVLTLCREKLEEAGIRNPTIKYNRKAGCSMCPCSPGYVIYDGGNEQKRIPYNRLIIWLKLDNQLQMC